MLVESVMSCLVRSHGKVECLLLILLHVSSGLPRAPVALRQQPEPFLWGCEDFFACRINSRAKIDISDDPRQGPSTGWRRASFAGFVFQVSLTIRHWLQLLPGQHLELGQVKDIDLIQAAAAGRFPGVSASSTGETASWEAFGAEGADALEAIAQLCVSIAA